jgi:hypothetical protein
MEDLTVNALRKIIIQELKKIMQREDALFSRGELSDTGTGTVVGLASADDEDDWYLDYIDDPDQCSICGHSKPCPTHDIEPHMMSVVIKNQE